MQFVACRELKDFVNGVPVVYKPGDVIPNFEAWEIHARRAHLELEWVKPADPGGKPVEQRTFRVTTLTEEQVKALPETPEEPEAFKCDHCDREFKTKRAFSTHVTRAHKK